MKMNNIVAVCPGSYAPVTKGHEDIVRRAADLFGNVCVVVCENKSKRGMFTSEERLGLCEKVFADDPRIKVAADDGLVVDFCKKIGAKVLVKGVRNSVDYEYEANIANINDRLSEYGVETVMLASRPELCYVSSSAVRELLSFGADVSDYVSGKIINDIRKKYSEEV